jgi:hypothetical protein
MPKGQFRVRHLTLVPNSDLCNGREEESSKDDDDSVKLDLDRKRLSRSIELSVAASSGNRRCNHKHGIKPIFILKF